MNTKRKKLNILVFPCGSEIGLDIYSSVRYSTYFHLIGANSISDHGKFVYEDYIGGVPFVTDSNFISYIKNIVEERQIDAIYPAMDSVITKLKENENILGCKIVTSPLETTRICLSKEKTYECFHDVVYVPHTYKPEEVRQYPVFVKPKIGYGGKGTKKINSKKELFDFIEGKDNFLIVDYLPGDEYTVDCFTDRHRSLLYSAARKRGRIRDGISVNTAFENKQTEFVNLARKINLKLSFRGAWFYQVKRDKEGKLCLLEIASRLGGSSLLSRAVGINLAQLSLFDAFDYDVKIQKNDYYVELDRALDNCYKTDLEFDSVYVDYDDCLILDKKKVNTTLISFLYKCVNEEKKIYLLSKHEGNLEKELTILRLDTLFDKVIHIDKYADKCSYIKSDKAIFVDDSFAERENVLVNRHIPVFSPEMVDIFLNV
jgi:hypothetical protein